jgi:hypothetical protein
MQLFEVQSEFEIQDRLKERLILWHLPLIQTLDIQSVFETQLLLLTPGLVEFPITLLELFCTFDGFLE